MLLAGAGAAGNGVDGVDTAGAEAAGAAVAGPLAMLGAVAFDAVGATTIFIGGAPELVWRYSGE
jgi:hypothetical protein